MIFMPSLPPSMPIPLTPLSSKLSRETPAPLSPKSTRKIPLALAQYYSQSRRHPNEITRPSITRTSVSSDVGDESTTNDESGFGTDDTEGIHGVDDFEHGLERDDWIR